MAQLRCTTFNTLNTHMPNLHELTLASHNKSINSPSITPPNSSWRLQSLLNPVPDDDFQSNAQVETNARPENSRAPLSGLGIHLPERSSNSAKASYEETQNTPSPSGIILCHLGDRPAAPVDIMHRSYQNQLEHSWPFSSSVSGSNSEDASSSSACPLNRADASKYPDLSTAPEWSLDSIAAASGMSVHLLAEQLSSSADLALQYMSQRTLPPFSSLVSLRSSGNLYIPKSSPEQPAGWPVLPDYTADLTPVLGTNAPKPSTSFGVNPADIMRQTFYESDGSHSFVFPSTSGTSSNSLNMSWDTFSNAGNSERSMGDIGGTLVSDCTSSQRVSQQSGDDEGEVSEYEQPTHTPSSQESSPFPSPRSKKQAPATKWIKRRGYRPRKEKIIPVLPLDSSSPGNKKTEHPTRNIILGSPVFDAHKGIDLDDLRGRAERYRQRNPNQDYDNSWLVSFVGKLSRRGELVEEFRCYVDGCDQSNKRRDHILIHVGAHLGQRPYQCTYCTSRFLRKNECKRHELSHSGDRPFVCDQCEGASFVRQDLLKRHITRAHNVKRKRGDEDANATNKENNRCPVKRVRRK